MVLWAGKQNIIIYGYHRLHLTSRKWYRLGLWIVWVRSWDWLGPVLGLVGFGAETGWVRYWLVGAGTGVRYWLGLVMGLVGLGYWLVQSWDWLGSVLVGSVLGLVRFGTGTGWVRYWLVLVLDWLSSVLGLVGFSPGTGWVQSWDWLGSVLGLVGFGPGTGWVQSWDWLIQS